MTTGNSVRKLLGAGALGLAGLAGLGFGGSAMAQEVYWSLGIGSPGVQVGVSNAPPVVYQQPVQHYYPRAVVVQPQPVYVQPAPVQYAYPVYSSQYPQVYPQVYSRQVAPVAPVVYGGWLHGHHGWHHGRGYGHGYWQGSDNGHGQWQGQQQLPVPQRGGHR